MPRLISPDAKYQDTYLAALREFQAEGRYLDKDPEAIARDFPAYVRELLGRVDPANASPGRVAETVLWLIDGDVYAGRVSIRHELNENLRLIGGHIGYEIRPSLRRRGYGTKGLRLALPHARAIGLRRVLITCDETNVASKKIIEANGGVFENSVQTPESFVKKLRYWIELGDSTPVTSHSSPA
jgi:predicted acetyltransferase